MAQAAGWLVQVKVPGDDAAAEEEVGAASAAASFLFFNVAIETPDKAVEAVRAKIKASKDTPIRAVRALSDQEIGHLRLAPEAIKPA